MRVVILSKACLVGAYQTKLEGIAAHKDVELTVLVPEKWADASGDVMLERAHTKGYDLLVEPIRFNGNFHFHYYPQLKKRLQHIQPDIVHLDEEPYNVATWLGMKNAQAVGAKTLFFSWQNLHRNYPPPFSMIEQNVLQNIDYGLMGNADALEVWRKKGFTGKAKILPQFGVSTEIFTPPHRNEDVGDNRPLIIGSTNRRLVPEKGIDLLLEACAALKINWQLRLTGGGQELENLKQQARDLGIADRVQFDGSISSLEMPDYLRKLDILVLPSRTVSNWKEQFGRVLIEAMACEVIVVGSDSGEIPNVIADAGLIFPEDDLLTLTKHLVTLTEQPALREQLRKRGRQHVLEKYTQAQIANQTVDVYREMMATN